MVRLTREQALRMGVPPEQLPPAPSESKYRNRRVYDDEYGVWFHSGKEHRRFRELLLAQRHGVVRNLRRQVPYPLTVEGELVTTYVADFVYEEEPLDDPAGEWVEVVEDVKSEVTRKIAEYVIKRNLMWAVHGIRIREY